MQITKLKKRFFGYLRAETRKSNKKLLLAAVLLFSAFWTLVSPIKGAEFLLLSRSQTTKNESITIEQARDNLVVIPANYLLASVNAFATDNNQTINLDIPAQGESSEEEYYEEEYFDTLGPQSALIAPNTPSINNSQAARSEVSTYVVQEGDVPSSIASSFGISLNTLLWANKLRSTSLIKPGDELIILPVSGVLHRVKSQDTVDSIAKYYKGDKNEIISFNNLSDGASIQIGQKLIVPNGQVPAVSAPAKVAVVKEAVSGPGTGKSHTFPYGQCTWYVAQKRYVPWSGNAKSWLVNSQAFGFTTGPSAQVGAIMVLTDGGWLGKLYGHVAYVEAINGEWITISEMNYNCKGCRSVRTLKSDDWRIKGYIY